MEKRDLRLYRYGDSQLYKHHTWKYKAHMFTTIEECENVYKRLLSKSSKNMQYVIVEYFATYESKIIKILNPEDYS